MNDKELQEWGSLMCPACREGGVSSPNRSRYCNNLKHYNQEHLHRTCSHCGYEWESKIAPSQNDWYKSPAGRKFQGLE